MHYQAYHPDAETLLVATYVWVDDTLEALQPQGIRLPKPQRHQKASLSELLTFLGLDRGGVGARVRGDRGGKLGPSGPTRWVEGVVTPPYRTRGGKVVFTAWMGRVRNRMETRFSVMVRSLGLHRLAPWSYWGLVARVNLILLAHNL
ncbi:hypothetical protein [Thermus tenuipuniceus]|uniref:hypothetical protein n=1 Tax=Thermus tenuipuniceus TaxID=2078690 RepID=UPI000CF9838F